jgi:hypothetical protein
VLPELSEWPGDLVLQQDNAPPHAARSTQNFLTENRVEVLQWPAQSPDLSAIELLWNDSKPRLQRLAVPLTSRELIIKNVFEIFITPITLFPGKIKITAPF